MPSISVVITVYNEENYIADCIQSARLLTDNITVVDTGSTDRTVALVTSLGAEIKHLPFRRYVEPSRKYAITSATSDWVLVLDADERISKELADEILAAVSSDDFTHYTIPRRNIFAGRKWLRYGGWYPDQVLRLIKTSSFKAWPDAIHSSPVIDGNRGELKNDIIHYFHPSLEQMVSKTTNFEEIEAELLFQAKKKSGVMIFFRKYFGELYRRLVKKMGFRDGAFGVIEAAYQAYSKSITYLILYEKQHAKSTTD